MSDKIKSIKALGFPWQTQDPFLFCAYHKDDYPAGNSDFGPNTSLSGRAIGQDFDPAQPWRMYHGTTVPGFPQHPHRGFETVTIAKKGLVDHSDSLGAAGRFGHGDVQWMTAGKGVLHAEMFPLLNQDKDNHLELFQIWLNLPRKNKMVDPHFKMLWHEQIPKYHSEDKHGRSTTIDVIAGKIEDVESLRPAPNSWAEDKENQVAIWTIKIEANAQWLLPAASPLTSRTLYFYQGKELMLDGTSINVNHSVETVPDEEISFQNGPEDAYLLLLQGKPISEPVAQHGPFVMNTSSEIQEAFAEFRRTQFGGWPWPKNDQVHDRSRGRFALHANGIIEEK